jgi:hypothetical protein
MYDYNEQRQVLRLIEVAIVLAEEAEHLHGQPLYYDEDGNSVEIVDILKSTAKAQREFLAEEGQLAEALEQPKDQPDTRLEQDYWTYFRRTSPVFAAVLVRRQRT